MPPSAEPFFSLGSSVTRAGSVSFCYQTNELAFVSGAAITIISHDGSQRLVTPSLCSALSSISFHPSGKFIAIGEAGGHSRVLILSLQTTSAQLTVCSHRGEVSSLSWNTEGNILLSLDSSVDGNFYLHKFDSSTFSTSLVLESKAEATVYDSIWFNPFSFCTLGLRHVKFWTFEPSGSIEGRLGMLGANRNSAFIASTFNHVNPTPYFFAVSSRGHLCQFGLSSRVIEKWVDTKITSPNCISTHGKVVAVGGKHGTIRLFNSSSLSHVSALPLLPSITTTEDLQQTPASVFVKSDVSESTCDVLAVFVRQEKDEFYDVSMITANKGIATWQANIETKNFNLKFSEVLNSQGVVKICQTGSMFHMLSVDGTVRSFYLSKSTVGQSNFSAFIQSLVKLEPTSSLPTTCAVSEDAALIVVGFSDGTLCCYDLSNGKQVYSRIAAHDGSINCIVLRNFESNLLCFSTGIDRTLVVSQVSSNFSPLLSFSDHTSSASNLVVTPLLVHSDVCLLGVVTGGADGLLCFYSLQLQSSSNSITCNVQSSIKVNAGTTSIVSMAYGPPSSPSITCSHYGFIAVGTQDKRIVMYDVLHAKTIRTFRPAAVASAPEPSRLAIDDTGTMLLSAGGDRVIRLINLKTGSVLSRCYGHASVVSDILFCSAEDLFLSAGLEGIMFVWKVIDPPSLSPLIHVTDKYLPLWARKKASDASPFVSISPENNSEGDQSARNKWKRNLEEYGPVALPSLDSTALCSKSNGDEPSPTLHGPAQTTPSVTDRNVSPFVRKTVSPTLSTSEKPPLVPSISPVVRPPSRSVSPTAITEQAKGVDTKVEVIESPRERPLTPSRYTSPAKFTAPSIQDDVMRTRERLLKLGIHYSSKVGSSSQPSTPAKHEHESPEKIPETPTEQSTDITTPPAAEVVESSPSCATSQESPPVVSPAVLSTPPCVPPLNLSPVVQSIPSSDTPSRNLELELSQSFDHDAQIDGENLDESVEESTVETDPDNSLQDTPYQFEDETCRNLELTPRSTRREIDIDNQTPDFDIQRQSLADFRKTFDELLQNFTNLTESKQLTKKELSLATEFGDFFSHLQTSLAEVLTKPSVSTVLESTGYPLPVLPPTIQRTVEHYSEMLVQSVLKKLGK
ncbi:hypothetical protein RCL1_007185 [Eukaryota sp. TZLM3-RCL]